jgi:hypothetical protein
MRGTFAQGMLANISEMRGWTKDWSVSTEGKLGWMTVIEGCSEEKLARRRERLGSSEDWWANIQARWG